jgi:SagB-type dehydrogenase family enzyme
MDERKGVSTVKEDVGDLFQQATKYRRDHLLGRALDWAGKPGTRKEYPSAPRIPLGVPRQEDGPPLWETMQARRSVRQYQETPIAALDLSQLLWAAQGVTRTDQGFGLRTTPSAGALYPVETYIVVHSVQGIDPGVYHYSVERHELEQLRKGDFREPLADAAMGQGMAATANAVFVWTAVFQRCKWKYGQRAYRYVYLDAGHIAQNVALAAVALGLASCQIGALYDDEVNALVGADGKEESVLYMTTVGTPRP